MRPTLPEVWLRGPIEGFPVPLLPVAHALLQVREEIQRAAADLTADALWAKPGTAASVGFHLRHLVGSTDRLLTYARGEALSEAQRQLLAEEDAPPAADEDAQTLTARAQAALDRALDQLRATDPETLNEPRAIGQARLPSTHLGILYHIGEHAARHAGQIVTTAKVVRGGRPNSSGYAAAEPRRR